MLKNKIMAGAMALIMPFTMCLTGCSFVSMFNTFAYQYDNALEYKAGDREISDKVTKINLDYIAGDVTIKANDSDKVSVKETANISLKDPQKVHTWVNDGTLYVRFCQSTKKINFTNVKKSLELTLPASQDLDDVIIEMSSGDLVFDGLTTDGFKVKSSSGDVRADLSGNNIDIKSSSGKIYFTQKGDSEAINLKASSGTIDIKQSGTCKSMTVNSSSGSVTGDVDKISKMDVHVSSGKINITANNIEELTSKASSGHCNYEFQTAPKTSDINVSSGGITVSMPEDSDVKVEVRISSGKFNSEIPFTKDGKTYTAGNGTNTMKLHSSSGDVDIRKV
ncbi:MAG: DUF4097 family beta strand repeat protein [Clostridiales bacterium]|nr:DUF4097 family beta strand repeat protein [Clostridiales bacterium]